MYNSSGGGFIFSTAPIGTEGERIRITGAGSLGIGTATPGASLDVAGTIKTNIALVLGGATFAAPSGIAPLFGARAWVLFNSSGLVSGRNISAVNRFTDGNGKPYYRFFFTEQPPSALYCAVATHNAHAGYGVSCSQITNAQISFTEFRFYVSGSETDPSYGCVVWFW